MIPPYISERPCFTELSLPYLGDILGNQLTKRHKRRDVAILWRCYVRPAHTSTFFINTRVVHSVCMLPSGVLQEFPPWLRPHCAQPCLPGPDKPPTSASGKRKEYNISTTIRVLLRITGKRVSTWRLLVCGEKQLHSRSSPPKHSFQALYLQAAIKLALQTAVIPLPTPGSESEKLGSGMPRIPCTPCQLQQDWEGPTESTLNF